MTGTHVWKKASMKHSFPCLLEFKSHKLPSLMILLLHRILIIQKGNLLLVGWLTRVCKRTVLCWNNNFWDPVVMKYAHKCSLHSFTMAPKQVALHKHRRYHRIHSRLWIKFDHKCHHIKLSYRICMSNSFELDRKLPKTLENFCGELFSLKHYIVCPP